MKTRIGIPNRGRLATMCCEIINIAFNVNIEISSRIMTYSTHDGTDDIDIFLLRSTDIPMLLHNGYLDIGITGNDYFLDSGANITEANNLFMFNGYLCLLTQKYGNIACFADMISAIDLFCFSQYKNISKNLMKILNPSIKVNEIDGAAESYFKLTKCDIIIDVVTSGSTFTLNGLKIISPIMPVSTHIYINNNYLSKSSDLCEDLIYRICGQKLCVESKNNSITYMNYLKFIKQIDKK